MSARLKRNTPLIKQLIKSNKRSQKKIVEQSSADFLDSLCECALNILKGNVPLTKPQFKKLKGYHKLLKCVARKNCALKKKKTAFQSGGFLGAILKPIASLLFGGLGG